MDTLRIAVYLWALWAMVTFLRAQWFMVCPPNPPGKLRGRWFMAGFDMWLGVFLDRKNKTAYWFPVPFVGRKYWRAE